MWGLAGFIGLEIMYKSKFHTFLIQFLSKIEIYSEVIKIHVLRARDYEILDSRPFLIGISLVNAIFHAICVLIS